MPTHVRVLYLTMNPNRQSTVVPTEGWLRLLPSRGLSPVVVSREMGAFQQWVADNGIPSYQDALPFPDKSRPLPFLKSLWHLRRLIRKHRIELIPCNARAVYPIGQAAARFCGIPVVLSVHFTMDRQFCEWAFSRKRQPSRIFFISRGNMDACRPSVEGVISPDRWRLMYNGLDLERFVPDEHLRREFRDQHELDGTVAVGVACALRPRKQLEHLFEAAARIDSPALRVVVAGGAVKGDEAYAADLLGRARARLGQRLVLLGHRDELRPLYNGLDVFVNTSQEEACSISVMEALACGCPVLGYPSKSVDDQILPGGGEIVDQDDIAQLTARLTDWISDPRALAARRTPARNRADLMFDIRTLSNQLWEEYVSVARGVDRAH